TAPSQSRVVVRVNCIALSLVNSKNVKPPSSDWSLAPFDVVKLRWLTLLPRNFMCVVQGVEGFAGGNPALIGFEVIVRVAGSQVKTLSSSQYGSTPSLTTQLML